MQRPFAESNRGEQFSTLLAPKSKPIAPPDGAWHRRSRLCGLFKIPRSAGAFSPAALGYFSIENLLSKPAKSVPINCRGFIDRLY